MAILGAAIVVVGLLCLTDLLLTFGVIRRLREHTEQLTGFSGQDAPVTDLADGEIPAPFTALSTGGEQLSGPAGLRLVAFFSAGCSACPERVPAFLDYLRANQIARDEVFVVITSAQPDPVSYAEQLAEVAPVGVEPLDGELAAAFKVRGFPSFFLLDGAGSVSAASHEPASLPALAATQPR
jgi:hypothetical protein